MKTTLKYIHLYDIVLKDVLVIGQGLPGEEWSGIQGMESVAVECLSESGSGSG